MDNINITHMEIIQPTKSTKSTDFIFMRLRNNQFTVFFREFPPNSFSCKNPFDYRDSGTLPMFAFEIHTHKSKSNRFNRDWWFISNQQLARNVNQLTEALDVVSTKNNAKQIVDLNLEKKNWIKLFYYAVVIAVACCRFSIILNQLINYCFCSLLNEALRFRCPTATDVVLSKGENDQSTLQGL